jgi:Zn-dependent M28 family amino/carboxypeptidase
MISGADPAVAGEAVILSAHYDHLGASQIAGGSRRVPTAGGSAAGSKPKNRLSRTAACRLPATVFPGADDVASGVAVVLGAARTLSRAEVRPRRTILFCLWSAEECGLLGSRAYVDHPLVPLERTQFVLQVEMVGAGRTDTFETSSAGLAGTGSAALRESASELGLTLAADTCKGVSDHLPFIRRAVPALVLTTTGDHPDYHTCRDTPDRLHSAGIENATRLCAKAIWQVANQD